MQQGEKREHDGLPAFRKSNEKYNSMYIVKYKIHTSRWNTSHNIHLQKKTNRGKYMRFVDVVGSQK